MTGRPVRMKTDYGHCETRAGELVRTLHEFRVCSKARAIICESPQLLASNTIAAYHELSRSWLSHFH